jgi:hypothetical protein
LLLNLTLSLLSLLQGALSFEIELPLHFGVPPCLDLLLSALLCLPVQGRVAGKAAHCAVR